MQIHTLTMPILLQALGIMVSCLACNSDKVDETGPGSDTDTNTDTDIAPIHPVAGIYSSDHASFELNDAGAFWYKSVSASCDGGSCETEFSWSPGSDCDLGSMFEIEFVALADIEPGWNIDVSGDFSDYGYPNSWTHTFTFVDDAGSPTWDIAIDYHDDCCSMETSETATWTGEGECG